MENMTMGPRPGQRVSNHMIDALVAREVARIRAEDEAARAAREAEAARTMKAWQDEVMRLAAKEGRLYGNMTRMTERQYRPAAKTRRQKLGAWCLGWYGWIALGLNALLRGMERLGLVERVEEP